MRAVGVLECGGPDALQVVDLPEPHADAGQIRVRVHAATVNPGDTILRARHADHALRHHPLPYIPGMELAGVLDEIGPHTVTGLAVGDHVLGWVNPTRRAGGAYAEYVCSIRPGSPGHQPARAIAKPPR
jgi:NADPH:quinone reductase